MTDIVIVGAGPVGLWTAVQTKIRNPDANIVLLDKHKDYKRSHVLKLKPSSFKKGIPQNPRLNKFVNEFSAHAYIPTNTIESKLKKLAEELGVKVQHQEIKDPRSLKEQFPNAKVIIGAGGSHSVIRDKIFEAKLREAKDLQYIAEVKYHVKGKGKKFRFVKSAYPTLKLIKSIATEHIGKEKDGKTPITLRLFINQEAFKNMSGATFKNPYTFATNKNLIHNKLLKKINLWLNAKKEIADEQRVEGSEKITVTRLGVYESQTFVKKEKNSEVTWCLVGDAAFGVPFFRSLNNGLLSGTQLAKAVSTFFNNQASQKKNVKWKKDYIEGEVAPCFASYAGYVRRLSRWEIVIAKIKNFFIRLFQWFVRVSSVVPWQVNKWSDTESLRFRATPVNG